MNGDRVIYPGCGFTMVALREAELAVSRHLESRVPFSLIRLGDGEGAVLSRPAPENDALWRWARHQLGDQITLAQMNELADQLQAAIDMADFVGVRDDIVKVDFPDSCFHLTERQFLERFRASFHLRSVERDIGFAGALRLAHTHRFLGSYGFAKTARFCSAWVHFHLSSGGALAKYLRREERPALVAGRQAVATELQQRLDRPVDYYRLPHDYPNAVDDRTGQNPALDAYVDEFRRTADLIEIRYPGQLFLVGGGVWSKAICTRVKQLGGIALDIGAVCDAWIGIPSRPIVYRSMFDAMAGTVPDSLLLSVQIEKNTGHA